MTMANDSNVESILSLFDSTCFSFGDEDAIVYHSSSLCDEKDGDTDEHIEAICYLELQEYSKDVAAQLWHRFRPSYVLVDCLGHAAAEAVSLLACMRIGVPFVPVSAAEGAELSQGQKPLLHMVQQLRSSPSFNKAQQQQQELPQKDQAVVVAAIVCCHDDRDPILGVFAQADIHQILFIDPIGNLRERLHVKSTLPTLSPSSNDNLYVLFTSGTSSSSSTPKAVVGSHSSTLRRLKWFHDTFEPLPRIGRRSKLTFVDGVNELLGALLVFPPQAQTQKLVVVHPDQLQHEGIVALLDAGVNQLTLLPSQLAQLLLLLSNKVQFDRTTLTRVIVSGEPCPSHLIRTFQEQFPKATLINLYGQTETTGDVCCAILTDMNPHIAVVRNVVAVGCPILPCITIQQCHTNNDSSRCSQNNDHDDDATNNETKEGELIVRGNLSNGYLNSSETFDEFATGDVGFYQNGNWYIQGRKGDACKVNGVWTHPTEIEAVFCTFYEMHDCVVVATILDDHHIYVLVDRPVPNFSRERMRSSGLPWNVIPKQIILHPTIPRKSTGAGKVDRHEAKVIVERTIEGMESNKIESFESFVAQVLNLSLNEIDMTKSFVEHGGDSASAVTFLYKMRMKFDANFTAIDILESNSLHDLKQSVMDGVPLAKRQKVDPEKSQQHLIPFRIQEIIQFSSTHSAIQFKACVDAPPLIHNGVVYGGCQGGVVQRLNIASSNVDAYYHFRGWMINADLTIHDESLIVCLYTRESKSMVTSLSLDLQTINWQHQFEEGTILSSPVVRDGLLWINVGLELVSLSPKCGSRPIAKCHLPLNTSKTRPIVQNETIVYASSEFDTGLMTVDSNCSCSLLFSDVVGPVYKNPTQVSDGSILVTDSYGQIHHINLEEMAINSRQVSNMPLTSPCIIQDRIVVGSYDSMVYCLSLSHLAVMWTFDAQAAVYARPLGLRDHSVIICTTAGDVVRLNSNGEQIWKHRILAEIWSDPVELDNLHVAFGARDSRLHLLSIELE
jgi:acyl-coenzyme A synthetase/AMP-(fatty) acid ligase